MSAVAGWEDRARLLLQLLKIFEGGDLAVAYLDSSTMSVMDLAFRTQERKCMMKIQKLMRFLLMMTSEQNMTSLDLEEDPVLDRDSHRILTEISSKEEVSREASDGLAGREELSGNTSQMLSQRNFSKLSLEPGKRVE